LKKVKITHKNWSADVLIDDEDPKTLRAMKSQLMHWASGEHKIEREKGNVEQAYLKMLGQELAAQSIEKGLTEVVEKFEFIEGFFPLDGSYGVRLITLQHWEFDANEFNLEEIP